jgi:lysophospholipase L1-like esterase
MVLLSRVIRRRTALAALAIALTAGAVSAGGSGAVASNQSSGRPYLALGDSVAFGYTTNDGPAYVNAANFVGYPQDAGTALHLDTANLACPGEASTGFLSITGADNNCRTFRGHFPLHVTYGGTQMDKATSFLKAHRETKLVTLQIGANDGFLLIDMCGAQQPPDPNCVTSHLNALVQSIAANVHTILSKLRATGYDGVLMIVNYYSLNYLDPAGTGFSTALNTALDLGRAGEHTVLADVFTAFQKATATATMPSGGDTCKFGLLNGSPKGDGTCDVHPSVTGQQLLARTVERAYSAATGEGSDN